MPHDNRINTGAFGAGYAGRWTFKGDSDMTSENASPARCFVIQPFGKKQTPSGTIVDNDAVYSCITRIQHIRPQFPIKVYRADTEGVADVDLHANIIRHLQTADFCIADFTGSNPNVLYETGYARGIGLDVVVLSRDLNDVPSDLKGLLVVQYAVDTLDRLPTAISQHLDRIQVSVFNRHATTRLLTVPYYAKRSDAHIVESIRAARTKIDILQTNLSVVVANYLDVLIDTMRQNQHLELRILTLSPESVFVNFRSEQLGYSGHRVAVFRSELNTSLASAKLHLEEFGDRARIRVYDDFPTQIVFMFDGDILSSVVSATARSRDNCAFLVNADAPGAHKSFIEHFNRLWEQKSEAAQG